MFVYVVANFRASLERSRVVDAIEECASAFELHKQMEEHKPTRSHWHWKRADVTGTLEVTWNVRENQIVVSVHQNRVGADEWAKKQAPHFASALAKTLRATRKNLHVTHRH